MATIKITKELAIELSGPFDTYWRDDFFELVVPDFDNLSKLKEDFLASNDEELKKELKASLLQGAIIKFMIGQDIRELSDEELDYLSEQWGEHFEVKDGSEEDFIW